MEAKTEKIYPSALFESKGIALKQRLQKKLDDVKSFKNHINNIKKMITYFKEKNNKSKKIYKKFNTLTTILKSYHTFVIIATTNVSIN